MATRVAKEGKIKEYASLFFLLRTAHASNWCQGRGTPPLATVGYSAMIFSTSTWALSRASLAVI